MPKLENSSERQYDVSVKLNDQIKTVSIPASVKDENGTRVNGFADVDEAFLAGARKDPWFAAIEDSGDLTVKTSKPTKAETDADKAAAAKAAADKSAADKAAAAK